VPALAGDAVPVKSDSDNDTVAKMARVFLFTVETNPVFEANIVPLKLHIMRLRLTLDLIPEPE
jgi:hypothetical protein